MLLRYCFCLVLITAEVLCLRRDYGPNTFDGDSYQESPNNHHYEPEAPRGPPIGILTHKQAVTNDGVFNYVFAADNGLKQGESISPDGTRTGAYEYIDPSGKTIKVKYMAGKDGFRILEGDHIPKQPEHVEPIDEYQPPEYRKGYQTQEPQEEQDHKLHKKYPVKNEEYHQHKGAGPQHKQQPAQKYTQHPQQRPQPSPQKNFYPNLDNLGRQPYNQPQQYQQQQQQQQGGGGQQRHQPMQYNIEQRHAVNYRKYQDNGMPIGGGDGGEGAGAPAFKGGYNFEFKG